MCARIIELSLRSCDLLHMAASHREVRGWDGVVAVATPTLRRTGFSWRGLARMRVKGFLGSRLKALPILSLYFEPAPKPMIAMPFAYKGILDSPQLLRLPSDQESL